ncbi:AraC family transcriptional regulator [Stagnimonas aquatica]|nr:AraC family transcriptional regulator [Stagnimonas aquatica]
MSETPVTPDLDASPAEGVLQSLLAAYQLRARLTDRLELCGRWEEPEPDAPLAWFHLVEQGRCYIRADILPRPLCLEAGDLVLFPGGAAHLLCSAAEPAQESDQASAVLLCGEFEFEGQAAAPMIQALPPCLVVPSSAGGPSLRGLASLLRDEAQRRAFGSRAVMDKLSDALFVIALRHHLQQRGELRGLLSALVDPRLAPALAAIHGAPGDSWTVASLAERAHQSRAAFAQRFNEVLGEPPMRYLARWRMTEALRLLRDPRLSVAAVSGQLGFETEAAFRRGFKRIHGYGPGQARRNARANKA